MGLNCISEKNENSYEAESHAETEQASGVGHEPDDGDLLVPLDPGHNGVLDVHVDQGHVVLGVAENFLAYQLGGIRWLDQRGLE